MGNIQNKSVSNTNMDGQVKTAAGTPPEKPHVPGEGIRSMKTTGVFRALNFELYARPSKPVMIVGALAFVFCVGYIVKIRASYDKKKYYEAVQADGSAILLPRTSRWDS